MRRYLPSITRQIVSFLRVRGWRNPLQMLLQSWSGIRLWRPGGSAGEM